jgi:hypothetical protein
VDGTWTWFARIKVWGFNRNMPFKDAKKRAAYMRAYMKRRYLEDKVFAWEKALREERKLMRKALRRVALAEKWAASGEKVDERLLSLAFQWNQAAAEQKQKNKKSVGVRVPTRFESVP